MMKLCESAVFVCVRWGRWGGWGGWWRAFQPRGERLEKRTPRISFSQKIEKGPRFSGSGSLLEFLEREILSLCGVEIQYIRVSEKRADSGT